VPRDKWNNLTSKAKCTFTECRKEANKPGGGPASGIEGGLERCQMTFYLESILNNQEFRVLKNKDSRPFIQHAF
jgi:hypothetical protein